MKDNEALRKALARAQQQHTADLESGFDPEAPHEFSPEFEESIQRLKRRADHPTVRWTLQRVASFALVLLLGGAALLTTHADARAAFVGWFRELRSHSVVYTSEGTASTTERVDYRPAWIPEGYTEYEFDDTANIVSFVYVNADGYLLNISYTYVSDPSEKIYWSIDTEDTELCSTLVNGYPADLFLSTDPDRGSSLFWTTEDGISFFVSAFESVEVLIKIAENIK